MYEQDEEQEEQECETQFGAPTWCNKRKKQNIWGLELGNPMWITMYQQIYNLLLHTTECKSKSVETCYWPHCLSANAKVNGWSKIRPPPTFIQSDVLFNKVGNSWKWIQKSDYIWHLPWNKSSSIRWAFSGIDMSSYTICCTLQLWIHNRRKSHQEPPC